MNILFLNFLFISAARGTCNGLQHLAAMTTDINLAKYVNLLALRAVGIRKSKKVVENKKMFVNNDISFSKLVNQHN